jgi:hypothetical protein
MTDIGRVEMIEKDYIMRMIQQFARFLAAALFKIESGSVEEAKSDIQSACKGYLGLPFSFLLGIPDKELLKIFTLGGQLDVDRCYIAAQLLFCEAKARRTDRPGDSYGCYCRSLNLLLSCVRQVDDIVKSKAISTVYEILQELPDKELPTEILEKLLLFYEYTGEYAKAEDCLFRLTENGVDSALRTGESFYERLMEKTDQELEDGDLPRAELQEGLSELRKKAHLTRPEDV